MNTDYKAIYALRREKYNKINALLADIQAWARKNKKLIILRKCYNIIRFLIICCQIYLRKNKKLIIIGCGRSGTKYTSYLFHELGIMIGHERLEKHGISSWCLVPDTYKMAWGPSYNLIRNLKMTVVHQVRHPLDTISSVHDIFGEKSWDFISSFIPINNNDSKIIMAMKYWYFWNLLAEKKSIYTYRVENFENEIGKILQISNFNFTENIKKSIKKIPKKVNSGKHCKLCWEDLKNADQELSARILSMAKKYGY